MRVFVTGTGRCGTATFYQACLLIENYTAGYETSAGFFDFDYPDDHIEVAAHLGMLMGRVIERFPGSRWVHLQRDREACIESLASQSQAELDSFARRWCQRFQASPAEAAGAFYDCINANIRQMLKGQDFRLIRLEEAKQDWPDFWEWIGAEGDFAESLYRWDRKYNSRHSRGRDQWQ